MPTAKKKRRCSLSNLPRTRGGTMIPTWCLKKKKKLFREKIQNSPLRLWCEQSPPPPLGGIIPLLSIRETSFVERMTNTIIRILQKKKTFYVVTKRAFRNGVIAIIIFLTERGCRRKKMYFIFFYRAPGGELQMVLDRDEIPEERQVAKLLRQILDGVAFLHSLNVAHLDIKVSCFWGNKKKNFPSSYLLRGTLTRDRNFVRQYLIKISRYTWWYSCCWYKLINWPRWRFGFAFACYQSPARKIYTFLCRDREQRN